MSAITEGPRWTDLHRRYGGVSYIMPASRALAIERMPAIASLSPALAVPGFASTSQAASAAQNELSSASSHLCSKVSLVYKRI